MKMQLFKHQKEALIASRDKNRVAYYHDMGLGKTFTGAEKMKQLDCKVNLLICQKSKIDDWIEHFFEYYSGSHKEPDKKVFVAWDLTDKGDFENFFKAISNDDWKAHHVGVINYDLVFRRPELKRLKDFTLMLDESSMIQNENAKRSKFILSLNPTNVILLSGTPVSGKYERLWSQCKLLGWNVSKKLYWQQFIDYYVDSHEGFPITIIKGYKNVDRLKEKLREHGAQFLKTDDVFELPNQINNKILVDTIREYHKFEKKSIVNIDDIELVGDSTLTKMLYERQLCGQYNKNKISAFRDILESTNDRLIVFYNFNAELDILKGIAKEYTEHISIVNGDNKNLTAYDEFDDSITFIQYQAGAMGLNLQKANKIIYFTPPVSSELFEQSKKRIHRIGQNKPCFYYYLTCKNSIEERIYITLALRKDFTDKLFIEGK